ncbi:MAG: methionyl-tRNA formyltransferase [Flavobacteriales bacterium]
MTTPLRIVFMGTPEFAVASLDAIRLAGFDIVGVVTAPDKPSGRGLNMHASAVKTYAVNHGLRILQPLKLKDESFVRELASLQADLFVVVAFRMLPEVVWSMPKLGSINLHGSLLPQFRGAAPIQRAIMSGVHETGVTTFLLQHEIDTGHILFQERIPITEHMTAGELHDTMMPIGATLLVKTIHALACGEAQPIPQDSVMPDACLHAPKIFREDMRVDWQKSVREVDQQVRGLSPYPAAWTTFRELTLKIYAGKPLPHHPIEHAVETDGSTYLRFACADGAYEVTDVQLEGKKRMDVQSLLRGLR